MISKDEGGGVGSGMTSTEQKAEKLLPIAFLRGVWPCMLGMLPYKLIFMIETLQKKTDMAAGQG